MTIETTRAPEGSKPASAAAVSRGASAVSRAGAAGAPGAAGAGGGFAGLLSSLSAPDDQTASLETELSDTDAESLLAATAQDQVKNQPVDVDSQGMHALDFIPLGAPIDVAVMVPPAPAVATDPANAARVGALGDATAPSQAATPGAARLVENRRTPAPSGASPAQPELQDAGSQIVTQSSDVATLLDHRRASQSHTAAQTQLELRDARMQPASAQALATVDASRAAPAVLPMDSLTASPDRRDGRPGTGLTRTGLEGVAGGTVADRLGINPTYEVAATTATVPEGQVAETVSYWASHGVQSAELTLDGLGDEPVEVRISVEGDQAQIEFRSNQPDVRQALEGASAQLKALLSGEGLQLTGMSVGTSNRGASQGEGGQPKPSPRQARLVAMEPARATTTRAANPAVGQALDLYV